MASFDLILHPGIVLLILRWQQIRARFFLHCRILQGFCSIRVRRAAQAAARRVEVVL